MCEYCVQHSTKGKKWYLNARNYAKELAGSEFVKQFVSSYFSRDITPNLSNKSPSKTIYEEEFFAEKQKVDHYYQKYLHHQVITTEEVFSLLDIASKQTDEDERAVVLLPCICRYREYGSDPGLHCLGIAFTDDYTRRFPKYLGGGHQYVSSMTARTKLEEMIAKEKIVHAVSALGVPYIGLLCNCDMKVCGPYQSRQKFNISSPFYKGHYRATVDTQKCVGCGTCEEECPFEVPTVNQETSLSEINQNSCFGCGICLDQCPEGAISLSEVSKGQVY